MWYDERVLTNRIKSAEIIEKPAPDGEVPLDALFIELHGGISGARNLFRSGWCGGKALEGAGGGCGDVWV